MKQFVPFLLEATESATKALAPVIGIGKQMRADQVAVDAMREALSRAPFSGTVVIGEGERDEAPMLHIGEEVGNMNGVEVDIALDPLEGTGICASLDRGAMSVLACGSKNSFLHAPDVYMQKIAVGRGLPKGTVSLKYPIEDNLKNLSKAKGVEVSDLVVVVLKRSRHDELIRSIRRVGAKIKLINDGDIGAILKILLDNETDIYVGIGGAPEGVLAAIAVKACRGQMEGKLVFNSDSQKERALSMGITDINKIYSHDGLVKGEESVLVATGVTDGDLLQGLSMKNSQVNIHSLVFTKNEIQYLSRSIII